MNFFVEGLQGSGKTTLAQQLAERAPGYTLFREGDYSPVELAWCAWMSGGEYEAALEKYAAIRDRIAEKTVAEGARRVVCYTQVRTDIPGFYQDMERYEIYNGRIGWDAFRETVLGRYRAWRGANQIFECSLFQNTVEDMLLFRVLPDDGIAAFYEAVRRALEGQDYRILYLASDDVAGNIARIRRERSDGNGNELWFPMLLDYFDHCPYARANNKSGVDDLLTHLCHRQELELRLCREIFPDRAIILKSKAVDAGLIPL